MAAVANAEQGLSPTSDFERVTIVVARLSGLEDNVLRVSFDDATRLRQGYLERITRGADRFGGTVASRSHQRIVVTFGPPVMNEGDRVPRALGGSTALSAVLLDEPERAMRAALAMAEELHLATRDLGRPVTLSIGVCSAPRSAGSSQGVEHGDAALSVQDAIELASSFEHPGARGSVLCTYAVHREIRGLFDTRPLDPLPVRGGAQPIPLYEVLGERPEGVRLPVRPVLQVETRLWGRSHELGDLKRVLDRVLESRRPSGAVLLGEPGLGKSRLCHELARFADAQNKNTHILWTRCSFEAPPYAALVEPLLRKAGIGEGRPGDHGPRESRSLFRAMMNEVLIDRRQRGRRTGDPPPAAPTDEQLALVAEQTGLLGFLCGLPFDEDPAVRASSGDPRMLAHRAQEAGQAFLEALAKRGPVLLVVENVHLADQGSLKLMEMVLDKANGPICILGLVPSLVVPQGLRGRVETLALTPLDDAAARELCEQCLAPHGTNALNRTSEIVRLANGHPLLLEELVSQTVEAPGTPLATTLAEALIGRVARLPNNERILLLRAASLGEVFDPQHLLTSETRPVLRRLFARGLLGSADEVRRGAARFRHPLLRSALLRKGVMGAHAAAEGAIDDDGPRKAASAWAAALLERRGPSGVAVPGQVGRLYEEAGFPGSAATCAVSAVEHAVQRGAFDVAERILGWALPIVTQAQDSGPALGATNRVPPTLRAELLARAASLSHQLGREKDEWVYLGELAALVDKLGDRRWSSRVALLQSRAQARAGAIDRALEYAAAAVTAAQQAQDEQLLLEALALHGAMLRRVGALTAGQERHADARDLAERLGDRQGALRARLAGALAMAAERSDEESIDQLQGAAQAARDLGEQGLLLDALVGLVTAWRRTGLLHRAAVTADEALDLSQKLRHPVGAARVLLEMGEIERILPDLRRALDHVDRAETLLASAPATYPDLDEVVENAELLRARILLQRGGEEDLATIERTCDRIAQLAREGARYESLARALAALALVIWRRGGLSRATTLSAEALALTRTYPMTAETVLELALQHADLLRHIRGTRDDRDALDLDRQVQTRIQAQLEHFKNAETRAAFSSLWNRIAQATSTYPAT
jgi:hypothetical protein